MSTLKLNTTKHPRADFRTRYDDLVGIDRQKDQLIQNLRVYFDRSGLQRWRDKHHKHGLSYLDQYFRPSPLALLSGEVGCGKTELAQTVGSPLSELLGGKTVITFETPSDVRGGGLVGELSKRITASFAMAREHLQPRQFGILVIDEADDLATSRDQMQAHHEDRAGVNALIKEIDRVEKDQLSLAVILITNRFSSLDPAVIRRASTQLIFQRPDATVLRRLFQVILKDVDHDERKVDQLVQACLTKPIPFSYSDILRRIAKDALVSAWHRDIPFSTDILLPLIHETEPSPKVI